LAVHFRKTSPAYLANRPDSQPAAAQDQQSQPSQGESNVGDSSGRIFSMYSKAAEDEDNKMAERWQKDAEGILIFVSLRRVCRSFFVHNNMANYRPVYSPLPWPRCLP
jgi:hypothetical protein